MLSGKNHQPIEAQVCREAFPTLHFVVSQEK